MPIFNLFMFVAILGVGILCIYKNKEWATVAHNYYIRESKKHWYGAFFPWEKPWALLVFKAMMIVFGIALIIAAYPLAFGTVYL